MVMTDKIIKMLLKKSFILLTSIFDTALIGRLKTNMKINSNKMSNA